MTDAHDDDNPNPMLPDDLKPKVHDFAADVVTAQSVQIDEAATDAIVFAIATGTAAAAALGRHVKAAREGLGISLASLEFDTGVSESRLRAIEGGDLPDLDEAGRLASWIHYRAIGAPRPTAPLPRLRPPRQRKAKG